MAFISLRTASFRNLENAEVEVRGKDVFLIGENGQGKTNFLEALYYASYGSSFRGVRESELVRVGEKDCSVTALTEGPVNTSITILYKGGKKYISLDGKRIEDRKELLAVAPCIVFCHEDMEFVAGSPERRRWFFDQTQSLWDPLYLEDLQNYRKVLKTRNNILRKDSKRTPSETMALLDALDPQLIRYGHELIKKRQIEAEAFSRIFEPLYHEISGLDGITIRYGASWKEDNPDALKAELEKHRDQDVSFGLSLSGPHRDRYIFTRKGREFAGKASTGQRRLLSLLLRVAQARVFSDKTGKAPVLLLDDVLLELDGEKRQKFLSLMPGYVQAFFTFLPDEPYERYRKDDTIVYHVNEGTLKKV
jgi:DNA replication and repair protein RecF